jgi:hypothetical protein
MHGICTQWGAQMLKASKHRNGRAGREAMSTEPCTLELLLAVGPLKKDRATRKVSTGK